MTTTIHHISCGSLHAPPNPRAGCHCLLLEDAAGLALVDTGIGLRDAEKLDARLVALAGFQFDPEDTAARRVEALGFRAEDVRHAVLTHADPDHAGGLADFPELAVHASAEELASVASGHWRYVPAQFDHGPRWEPLGPSPRRWFGLEARPVPLGFASEVLLIPLFGHTLGHCGVAIQQQGDRWTLHVGDAYYLRVELDDDDHPVGALAASRADDDPARRAGIEALRRLSRDHGDEIAMFGYHDLGEFSEGALSPAGG